MKKISFLFAIIMSVSLFSFSQGTPVPNQFDEKVEVKSKKMNRFKTELDLTDAQNEEIRNIKSKYRPHHEAIDLLDDEEMKKIEHRNLRKAERDEITAVLSPEQRIKFEEMHAEKKQLKAAKQVESVKEMPLQDAK